MNDTTAVLLASSGLPAFARWRHRGRLSILMFHGVVERALEPFCWYQLAVADFERQMRWVARHYAVLPMSEGLARLSAGTLPPRAMSITFDDGYRNNLTVAAPVLEALRLPATIFLVTGTLGTDEVVWPDRLWLAFAHTSRPRIHAPDLGLDDVPLALAAERGRAFLLAVRVLKGLERGAKDLRLTALLAALGERTPVDPGPFRALTWEDVAVLQRTGRFEFGGHSVRHDILARSDDSDVAATISQSHREVTARTGIVPVAFAYPNGRSIDFDARARAVVSAAGLSYALSTESGWNDASADRLALRRFSIGADLSFARFRLVASGARDMLRG